jgi:hypothetical protein
MAKRTIVRAGDEILIASSGHSSKHPDRRGRIVAVLGEPGREYYVVAWPDGHESMLPIGVGRVIGAPSEPASGLLVRHGRFGHPRRMKSGTMPASLVDAGSPWCQRARY